jgi:hypothetical protein
VRVLFSSPSPEGFATLLNEFFYAHSWTFSATTLVATHAKNGRRIPDDTPELAVRKHAGRYQLLHKEA